MPDIIYLKKLISFILFFCLTSCSSHKPSPIVFADNIMTINYRILIGDDLDPNQRIQIQQIIADTFTEIDSVYNKWNPKSEISQLNQLQAGQTKELSQQLFAFLNRINHFVELSHGKFDPTIEPMQQLWKEYLEKNSIPNPQEIESLKPAIGWDKIKFDNGVFQKTDSRTMLDFGGIAKGYCVDLLVERLRDTGFKNLFVEWGGEIRTLGLHPSGRPWSIYISKLGDNNPNHAIAQLNLIDQAIATSGDYYQNWTIHLEDGQTKTYCHIFNPTTLSPIEIKSGSVASASLLADDCLTADTLAKVLMLFETSEEAHTWAKTIQEKYPEMSFWIVTH